MASLLLGRLERSILASLHSSRIRLTAIAVSQRYVICAANTGSLYVFSRKTSTEGQQLLRLVTLPETRGRVIVKVCIAPSNDNVVAVATSEGTVVALMLNIEDRNLREKTLSVVEHHRRANTAVTAVCWSMVPQHAVVETLVSPRDDEGLTHMRLFSGDAKGNVYVTEVEIRSQNRLFRPFADSSVMKRKVTSCLVRCDGREPGDLPSAEPVVQMAYRRNRLLVSSSQKVLILDFDADSAIKLGSKPRDGPYGVCFHPSPTLPSAAFAARPGKRLWLADVETHKVVSTLNFKRSLGGTRADGLCDPFACFFTGRGGNAPRPSPTTMFSRLVPMATEDRAVVLCHDTSDIVLLDPSEVAVLQWLPASCFLADREDAQILDLAAEGSEMWMLLKTTDGEQHVVSSRMIEPEQYISHMQRNIPHLTEEMALALAQLVVTMCNTDCERTKKLSVDDRSDWEKTLSAIVDALPLDDCAAKQCISDLRARQDSLEDEDRRKAAIAALCLRIHSAMHVVARVKEETASFVACESSPQIETNTQSDDSVMNDSNPRQEEEKEHLVCPHSAKAPNVQEEWGEQSSCASEEDNALAHGRNVGPVGFVEDSKTENVASTQFEAESVEHVLPIALSLSTENEIGIEESFEAATVSSTAKVELAQVESCKDSAADVAVERKIKRKKKKAKKGGGKKRTPTIAAIIEPRLASPLPVVTSSKPNRARHEEASSSPSRSSLETNEPARSQSPETVSDVADATGEESCTSTAPSDDRDAEDDSWLNLKTLKAKGMKLKDRLEKLVDEPGEEFERKGEREGRDRSEKDTPTAAQGGMRSLLEDATAKARQWGIASIASQPPSDSNRHRRNEDNLATVLSIESPNNMSDFALATEAAGAVDEETRELFNFVANTKEEDESGTHDMLDDIALKMATWLLRFDAENPPNAPVEWITAILHWVFENFEAVSFDSSGLNPPQHAQQLLHALSGDNQDIEENGDNSTHKASRLRFCACFSEWIDASMCVVLAHKWNDVECVHLLLELEASQERLNDIKSHLRKNARQRAELIQRLENLAQEQRDFELVQQLRNVYTKDVALVLRFLSRLWSCPDVCSHVGLLCADMYPSLSLGTVLSAVSDVLSCKEDSCKDSSRMAGVSNGLVSYLSRLFSLHSVLRLQHPLVQLFLEGCTAFTAEGCYRAPLTVPQINDDGTFILPSRHIEEPSTMALDKFVSDEVERNEHKLQWPHERLVLEVLEESHSFALDTCWFLQRCIEARFFAGRIQLRIMNGDRISAISDILHADDRDSFLQYAPTQLHSPAEWQIVVQKWVSIKATLSASNVAQGVEAQDILTAVLQTLGSEQALSILLETPVLAASLLPQSFASLLSAADVEAGRTAVPPQVLETVDNYLWSKQAPLLAAPMEHVRNCEREMGTVPSYLSIVEQASTHTDPLPRYYEEANRHWGVCANGLLQSECRLCSLPLEEYVGPSVSVLPCGHAFHLTCIGAGACPLCLTISSVLDG